MVRIRDILQTHPNRYMLLRWGERREGHQMASRRDRSWQAAADLGIKAGDWISVMIPRRNNGVDQSQQQQIRVQLAAGGSLGPDARPENRNQLARRYGRTGQPSRSAAAVAVRSSPAAETRWAGRGD